MLVKEISIKLKSFHPQLFNLLANAAIPYQNIVQKHGLYDEIDNINSGHVVVTYTVPGCQTDCREKLLSPTLVIP